MQQLAKVLLLAVALLCQTAACRRTMHTGINRSPSADAGAGGEGQDASARDEGSDNDAGTDAAPTITINMGDAGWRQSTQPLCHAGTGPGATHDLWADERGVFVLLGNTCQPSGCGADPLTVMFNAGAGWETFHEFAQGQWVALLSGFPAGPLLVAGNFPAPGSVPPVTNAVALVDRSGVALQDQAPPQAAFVVDKDLAYAVRGQQLLQYASGTWSEVGSAGEPLRDLWANEQMVIAVGYNQTVVMRQGSGPLTALAVVPVGNYNAVWAFGADDIWLGNTARQLVHYDGTRWTSYDIASPDPFTNQSLVQLWGADGVVYFRTQVEFGRIVDGKVERLLSPDGAGTPRMRVGHFWGRSAHEVFVPVMDDQYQFSDCAGLFALWFDGTRFHRF